MRTTKSGKIGNSASDAEGLAHTKSHVARKVPDFDWKIAKERHSKRVFDFLVDNFDKPLTESQFVEQIVLLRKSNLKENLYRGKRKNYRNHSTPSKAKSDYNQLKNLYGFFQ